MKPRRVKPKEYRDNLYDIKTGQTMSVQDHLDWLDWSGISEKE